MKYFRLFLLTLMVAILCGCKKDNSNETTIDLLANTSWQATLTDENPDSNPSGEFGVNDKNQYYPWLDCHLDDLFKFEDGTLVIDDKGTVCSDGFDLVFESKTQTYVYNAQSKKLTLGIGENSIDLDVFELNEARLKIGVPVPTGTGMAYIVLLFKRK